MAADANSQVITVAMLMGILLQFTRIYAFVPAPY